VTPSTPQESRRRLRIPQPRRQTRRPLLSGYHPCPGECRLPLGMSRPCGQCCLPHRRTFHQRRLQRSRFRASPLPWQEGSQKRSKYSRTAPHSVPPPRSRQLIPSSSLLSGPQQQRGRVDKLVGKQGQPDRRRCQSAGSANWPAGARHRQIGRRHRRAPPSQRRQGHWRPRRSLHGRRSWRLRDAGWPLG
jgi:hypothetical protein